MKRSAKTTEFYHRPSRTMELSQNLGKSEVSHQLQLIKVINNSRCSYFSLLSRGAIIMTPLQPGWKSNSWVRIIIKMAASQRKEQVNSAPAIFPAEIKAMRLLNRRQSQACPEISTFRTFNRRIVREAACHPSSIQKVVREQEGPRKTVPLANTPSIRRVLRYGSGRTTSNHSNQDIRSHLIKEDLLIKTAQTILIIIRSIVTHLSRSTGRKTIASSSNLK